MLISTKMVVRYFFNADNVERTHQKLPERRLTELNFFPKIQKYQKEREAVIYILH